jgi:hypothetical protein
MSDNELQAALEQARSCGSREEQRLLADQVADLQRLRRERKRWALGNALHASRPVRRRAFR